MKVANEAIAYVVLTFDAKLHRLVCIQDLLLLECCVGTNQDSNSLVTRSIQLPEWSLLVRYGLGSVFYMSHLDFLPHSQIF